MKPIVTLREDAEQIVMRREWCKRAMGEGSMQLPRALQEVALELFMKDAGNTYEASVVRTALNHLAEHGWL